MVLYKRCYFIFLIGGAGYALLEILWRGYTHPSMAIVGGVCLLAICFVNKRFRSKKRIFRAFICAASVTAIEFVTGEIINVALKLNVWNYSYMPFNIGGQVCLGYSLLWLILSYFIICVIDKAG